MHFRVIRLSSYWDQVDKEGYDQLDWLMSEAQQARQPIALTVGMKALGWPEFFVPTSVKDLTGLSQGQDVASDSSLRAAALASVVRTGRRYPHNPALVAWQIENGP